MSAPLAAQEPLKAADLESGISYAKFYTRRHLHDFQKFKGTKHKQLQACVHLFEKYELTPPIGLHHFGIFTNNTLQKLFTNFTMGGNIWMW